MRVLITGHAGFIGSHLARRLLTAGATVTGIDSVNAYYEPSLKRARLAWISEAGSFDHVETSLGDAARLREVLVDAKPDVVVHLAAQAGVRYSLEAPAEYIDSNLVGTFNLLESIRDLDIQHLLLASSSSVYGGNTRLPWAETDTTDSPLSLYAATKRATESLAHSYSNIWRIPTTAFRFFTVYGPFGRPDMALFKFVRAAYDDAPIDVYGYGRMRRDFTYIDDLIEAIVKLAANAPRAGEQVCEKDSVSPAAPFRAINIGGGSPVGLMDFISAVEDATGRQLKLNYLPMQPGDVDNTYADTTLLRNLVGSAPSTPVSEGVRRFVNWYNEYYRADSDES